MKLLLHAVLMNANNSSLPLPGDSLTTTDMAAVPLPGDRLVVPGHGVLIVDHRQYMHGATEMLIELFCR
jgi:hypothetical protein